MRSFSCSSPEPPETLISLRSLRLRNKKDVCSSAIFRFNAHSAVLQAFRGACPPPCRDGVYRRLECRRVVRYAVALRAEVAHIERAVRRKRDHRRRQDCSAYCPHFSPFVTLVIFPFVTSAMFPLFHRSGFTAHVSAPARKQPLRRTRSLHIQFALQKGPGGVPAAQAPHVSRMQARTPRI